MITLIATSRNEGDIMECWLRHHLAEGVDLILVADSSDMGEGTRPALMRLHAETGCVDWTAVRDPIHRQPALMNALARSAEGRGAEWLLASDIDEFWHTTTGQSIAELLADCDCETFHVKRYLHHGWDRRQTEPERLGKVAFRPRPDRLLINGNHAVSNPRVTDGALLEIRELHYRSFEHFKAKVVDRNRTLDPAARSRGDGSHHTRLEGMGEAELRAEYDAWLASPTVYDPIPSRSACRPRSPS